MYKVAKIKKDNKKMTDPEQQPDELELAKPAVIEQAPVSPERKDGFFGAIRDLGALAVERVVEITPELISRAGEIVNSAKVEIASRAPEVREQVEKVAGLVVDKVGEGYDATVDGARDVLRRSGELAGPIADIAKDTYVEVVKPIGGDVLTALGKEYGVEYEEKLKVKPVKLGRAVLRAIRNPVTALAGAASIAKKTATRSSVKMFVS